MVQNLDVQYTIGLATGVPVTFISVGNITYPTDEDFADQLVDTALYLLGLQIGRAHV